jgi:DNA-binding transcriptional MocR family regulator
MCRLADRTRSAIEAGELKAGDAIPPPRELAMSTGLGIAVVHSASGRLERERATGICLSSPLPARHCLPVSRSKPPTAVHSDRPGKTRASASPPAAGYPSSRGISSGPCAVSATTTRSG